MRRWSVSPSNSIPHHVVDFALMPFGCWPKLGDGIGFLVFPKLELDAQVSVFAVSEGVELVNHFPTRLFPEVVEAAYIEQVIVAEFVTAIREDFFGTRLFRRWRCVSPRNSTVSRMASPNLDFRASMDEALIAGKCQKLDGSFRFEVSL